MATIRKRGNHYHVQIRKQGHPQITKSFQSKKLALTYIKETEAQIERGTFTDFSPAETTTFDQIAHLYESQVLPRLRGSLYDKSRIKHLKQAFCGYHLNKIQPHLVASYKAKRLDSVSGSSVRKELGLLSRILTTAEREFGIYLPQGNPVTKTVLPRENASRTRRPTQDELDLLQDDSTVGFLVRIAVNTGLRRGEIARIEKRHIHGHLLHVPYTKTDEARTIPLNAEAREAIEERLEYKKQHPALRPSSITQAFQRTCERLGIENLRFHDLRHEATSRLFEKGLNTMEVASITGHKDLRMLRRYTHINPETLLNRI